MRCYLCIRYDLKQGSLVPEIALWRERLIVLFAEISKSPVSKVPVELAKHEAAQHRVSREMKRKREADDQG